MRHREHPSPDLLLRFLACETSLTETRAIVRHLLTGCPACRAVTRPVWRLADRPPKPPTREGPPQHTEKSEKKMGGMRWMDE